jgi:hypothetical protein
MRQARSFQSLKMGLMTVALSAFAFHTVAAADPRPAGAEPVKRPSIDPAHPLVPALEHAYKAREVLAGIKDYQGSFTKRERLEKKLRTSVMSVKVRTEPFSVYLLFHEPNKGREVIYVEGRNNNQLLAHETGFAALVGTVSRAIDSPDAMAGNRYPVTMIGLHHLLDRVIQQWEAEAQFGEVDVLYRPSNKLAGVECKVLESKHPQPRKQFKFHQTRLWIETESGLPVRVEQYDFPARGDQEAPLAEEYTYSKLQLNPGLTDRDFDIKNPNYAFSTR